MTVEKKTYSAIRGYITIYDASLSYVGVKLLTVDGLQFDPVANFPLSNREYQHDVSGGRIYINAEPLGGIPAEDIRNIVSINIIIAY